MTTLNAFAHARRLAQFCSALGDVDEMDSCPRLAHVERSLYPGVGTIAALILRYHHRFIYADVRGRAAVRLNYAYLNRTISEHLKWAPDAAV